MARAWVLVANHTHARLFEAEKQVGALHEIETLSYPEGRMRAQDIQSDAPGRAFDSKGAGRHAMGSEEDMRHAGARRFAHDIAHTLERGRLDGRYEKLYILAEPAMVGSLRGAMTSATRAAIAGETGKNLVTSKPEEIRAQLPDLL